ncbi:hypothetical protein OPQ81_007510 [Rhizoctonia solani]|nr:hypothetical protein OPQ81_007510 [Rhizoctonia solani]
MLIDMLDELRVASDLLRLALDRYLNACLAIKRSSDKRSPFASESVHLEYLTSPLVVNEMALLAEYEKKFRGSKVAILQYRNSLPDMVPINGLPVDILIHVFQQLVQEEHRDFSTGRHAIVAKYPITLAHVCTHWRRIALQSPSLWSCIAFSSFSGWNAESNNRRRLACVDFHSEHSRQALMNILITESYARTLRMTSNSATPIDRFAGRIRSLEFRLDVMSIERIRCLITKCLEASNETLRRFILHMHDISTDLSPWASVSGPANEIPMVDLPNDRLENVLYHITNLWLRGLYFNWESKVYHKLTTLRLDPSSSCTISELQLINILGSSPQLQRLNIGLKITRKDISPPPIRLPELEVLTGDTKLLQLVLPGSKMLSLNISSTPIYIPYSNELDDARVKDFFSRANIARFHSHDFLKKPSDICRLFSLAPRIQALALSGTKPSGSLSDIITYSSLDALYLLPLCEMNRSLLRDMIDIWKIKKIVYWGWDLFYDSFNGPKNKKKLEEELSDLGTTLPELEFVPHSTSEGYPFGPFV